MTCGIVRFVILCPTYWCKNHRCVRNSKFSSSDLWIFPIYKNWFKVTKFVSHYNGFRVTYKNQLLVLYVIKKLLVSRYIKFFLENFQRFKTTSPLTYSSIINNLCLGSCTQRKILTNSIPEKPLRTAGKSRSDLRNSIIERAVGESDEWNEPRIKCITRGCCSHRLGEYNKVQMSEHQYFIMDWVLVWQSESARVRFYSRDTQTDF